MSARRRVHQGGVLHRRLDLAEAAVLTEAEGRVMPIRARKRIRLGSRRLHVAWHFTQAGFTSWSVKVGPWSWNSRTRAHRVDLPGPAHWTSKRRRSR